MIIRAFEHCKRCTDLCATRKQIVWGHTLTQNVTSFDICFVSDAPSEADELFGRALVGPQGRILRRLLEDATLRTGYHATYYITTIVLCRCTDNGKTRAPTKAEVTNCQPRLVTEIQKVKPRILVPLGKEATMNTKSLSAQMSIRSQPLPHPNFIIRQGGLNSALYRSTMRDMTEIFKWLQK